MTTTTNNLIEQAIQKAETLGRKHGENAAHWVIQDTWGGRATRGEKEAAEAFLKGYEDGDPAVMDSFDAYVPNLANQWAGDLTPAGLLEYSFPDSEWSEDDDCLDAQDDICTAYQDAASTSFYDTLCQSAQSVLQD